MKNSELISLLQNLDPDADVLDGEERDITQVLDWVGNTIMIESDYKKYAVAKLSPEQEKEVNDAWDNFQKMREKQLTEADKKIRDQVMEDIEYVKKLKKEPNPPTDVTIEQVDKMLNDLGTNE